MTVLQHYSLRCNEEYSPTNSVGPFHSTDWFVSPGCRSLRMASLSELESYHHFRGSYWLYLCSPDVLLELTLLIIAMCFISVLRTNLNNILNFTKFRQLLHFKKFENLHQNLPERPLLSRGLRSEGRQGAGNTLKRILRHSG